MREGAGFKNLVFPNFLTKVVRKFEFGGGGEEKIGCNFDKGSFPSVHFFISKDPHVL